MLFLTGYQQLTDFVYPLAILTDVTEISFEAILGYAWTEQ